MKTSRWKDRDTCTTRAVVWGKDRSHSIDVMITQGWVRRQKLGLYGYALAAFFVDVPSCAEMRVSSAITRSNSSTIRLEPDALKISSKESKYQICRSRPRLKRFQTSGPILR